MAQNMMVYDGQMSTDQIMPPACFVIPRWYNYRISSWTKSTQVCTLNLYKLQEYIVKL